MTPFANRAGFIVRILRSGSTTAAGIGFVVGERQVVTCAHVINTALGCANKQAQQRPGPDVRLQIDFPILGPAQDLPSRRCQVAAWLPPPTGLQDPGGDVAVLAIVDEGLPAGAGPARLVDAEPFRGREADMFGYPADERRPNGIWARQHLSSAVGGGIVQLDTRDDSPLRAQPGYSGSPVIVADGDGDAVVGMLAITSYEDEARGDDEHGRDAYAIPVSRLTAACQDVLTGLSTPAVPGAESSSGAIKMDLRLELPPDLKEAPIKDLAKSAALPLSHEESQAVAALKEELIAGPSKDGLLARVEATIAAENAAPIAGESADQGVRRQALPVWWNLAQGLDSLSTLRIEEALQYFRRAVYGFALLGDEDQLHDVVIWGLASEGVLQIQRQNFAEGTRLFAEAHQFLENSSDIGTEQRENLASIEIGSLSEQAVQAFLSGNYSQGDHFLRSAATRADDIAGSHDDKSPYHRAWAGTAGLLRAYAAFMTGIYAIGIYDFDHVPKRQSVAAEKAARLLKDSNPVNADLAGFFAQVLGVLEELAAIMLRVLDFSFDSGKGEFDGLRRRVERARQVIPAVPAATTLAVECDHLDQWLDNLERLVNHNK